MTVAICLKCGATKFGAWTPCGECGYSPEDAASSTQHLLASSHFLSNAELRALAERVKAGEQVELSTDDMDERYRRKAAADEAIGRRYLLTVAIVIVLSVIGGLVLGHLRR